MALELISKSINAAITPKMTRARKAVSAGVVVQIATWRRQTQTENATTKSETVEVGHRFADISGLLEDHPLRDEYLEALGITE